MNVRVIGTVGLLLALPASAAAQTPPPRLDLTRLNQFFPVATPTSTPVTVRVPKVRQIQLTRMQNPMMSCDDSVALGLAHGREKSFSKWFFLGLGGGFGTSWFSFAWVPGLAHSKTRAPNFIPADVEPACYKAGFLKTARRNSTLAGALGSGIGAVLLQSLFIGWN